ncbi:hypothetical protein CRUP_026452, partial [Coryphaenoides rupestris]
GLALLHWACDRGHKELVSLLLQHKADINSQSGGFGFSPRALAVSWLSRASGEINTVSANRRRHGDDDDAAAVAAHGAHSVQRCLRRGVRWDAVR